MKRIPALCALALALALALRLAPANAGNPTSETTCGDTADNDGDGAIDCADTDCSSDATCVSRRQELLDQLRRRQVLQDTAPVAPPQTAAEMADNLAAMAERARAADPDLKAWMKDANAAIEAAFHPTPQTCAANPSAKATASANVASDGAVGGGSLTTPSGDAAFDAACVRAVQTARLRPLPPGYPVSLVLDLECVCPT